MVEIDVFNARKEVRVLAGNGLDVRHDAALSTNTSQHGDHETGAWTGDLP